MRVRLTDLTTQGLKLNDSLPLENINQRMAEGRDSDIQFTSAPEVNLHICATPGESAECVGSLKAKFKQPCSACYKFLDREIEVNVHYIFKPKPATEQTEPELSDEEFGDDVGIAFFEGEHIELEDLLQQELILAMDIYWRPERDAKNNCLACGRNCNSGVVFEDTKKVRLGDLLKNAISKN